MKKIVAFIIALLSFFNINAQKFKENALLWKISGKGIVKPSYLYGTFHLLCSNDLVMPDTLVTLLHKTKTLYFEIKLDDPLMTQKMMQSIMMKDNHDLKEFIAPEIYDSVAAIFLQKTKLPLTAMSKYKPFITTSILYPAMLGCTPVGFENEIMALAKKDSIPVKGLETVEFQLQVFDEIPYAVQAKMLLKNLLEFDKSVKYFKKMIIMYQSKNINKMQQEVADDKEFGAFENILLKKRNTNWIPIIAKSVKEQPCFFAVGAGHLAGENGVINLLRKAGFIITPIVY